MRGIMTERQVLTLEEYLDRYFPIIKASKLDLKDDFLNYNPETEIQKMLRDTIIFAIISGVHDFRAQIMDPSLDNNGNIFYQSGMNPAIGKNANWWRTNARMFIPEKESRLGNMLERAAFWGLFIQYLINEENYNKKLAWRAVCDNSKEFANYLDSPGSKKIFERTGNRKVGQWYDLGNTYKILYSDMIGFFLLCSGWSFTYGNKEPLAKIQKYDFPNATYANSVGWIVLNV